MLELGADLKPLLRNLALTHHFDLGPIQYNNLQAIRHFLLPDCEWSHFIP